MRIVLICVAAHAFAQTPQSVTDTLKIHVLQALFGPPTSGWERIQRKWIDNGYEAVESFLHIPRPGGDAKRGRLLDSVALDGYDGKTYRVYECDIRGLYGTVGGYQVTDTRDETVVDEEILFRALFAYRARSVMETQRFFELSNELLELESGFKSLKNIGSVAQVLDGAISVSSKALTAEVTGGASAASIVGSLGPDIGEKLEALVVAMEIARWERRFAEAAGLLVHIGPARMSEMGRSAAYFTGEWVRDSGNIEALIQLAEASFPGGGGPVLVHILRTVGTDMAGAYLGNYADELRAKIGEASIPYTQIGIDFRSLDTFGRWPFPRYRFADLVNNFSRIKNQTQRERALVALKRIRNGLHGAKGERFPGVIVTVFSKEARIAKKLPITVKNERK